MADTAEKDIFQAILRRMLTVPLPSGMTYAANVVIPGKSLTIQSTTRYISFEVHFNRSIETDLSLEMEPIRQGFVLGKVHFPLSWAPVDAVDLSGHVRALFKRGTKVTEEGRQVRFDQDPSLGPMITGLTHYTVPVTAFWVSYPQVPARLACRSPRLRQAQSDRKE